MIDWVKDHLGNIRQTFWDDGTVATVVSTEDYYPFGATLKSTTTQLPAQDKFKYQGKERDQETGYDYFEARLYDSQLGRFMQVDPHADRYKSSNPFVGMGDNPVRLVDPTGMDWYEFTDSEGNKSVLWKKGDAKTIDVDGTTYNNIGATYTSNVGEGTSITYTQDEATSITETVLEAGDFCSQMSGKFTENNKPIKKEEEAGNCYYQAGEMVKKSGATPLGGEANNATNGVNYIDSQIDKGLSIRVQVDRNDDNQGDHWVAISSRTTDLKTNKKTYGFFDPAATYANKGGINNTFNCENGKLSGVANAYKKRDVIYDVVTVRKNK